MSTHDEDRLSADLHRRAAEITDASATLEDVRRSAEGLRRRRRIAGGLAAVAVVAVAVPAVISGITATGGGSDRPAGPAAPPGRSVSSPAVPASPRTGPLTTRNAGRSSPPQVDYLTGATLHRVDGTTVDLPGSYTEVTAYHGGYLATEPGEQGYDVVTLDNTGAEVDRRPGDFRIALGGNGTVVSWLTGDQRNQAALHRAIVSGSSDAVDSLPVRASTATGPVGFVGSEQVVYQTQGEHPEVRVADFSDRSDRRLAGLIGVGGTSPSEPLLSGQVSSDDQGSCWVVREVPAARDLWRTCDFSLGRFSPDGRLVLGYPAYRDGAGDTEVAVLDARSGTVVAHWRSTRDARAVAAHVAWEDDDTLLATVFERGSWSMLRLDSDGSVTTALGPEPGEVDRSPWSFVTQP
jgi:hypothetical protein